MHKLLERQLREYKISAIKSPELQLFVGAINDAYIQIDEDYKLMEHTLEISSEEMIERNEELAKALEELKKTQTQLIHSEKMAILGQLIAGISHEINTPTGTIVNLIQEINNDHIILIQNLLELSRKLPIQLFEQFFEICKILTSSDNNSRTLATQEIREISRTIEEKLSEHHIQNTRSISKNLALIGFTADTISENLIRLLKTDERETIYHAFYQLGIMQIQVSDIKIAINRIANLSNALKQYSHLDKEALDFTNICEDIDNTLAIFYNRIKQGITVTKEYANIPLVQCYADQLNQVWTNLIKNAIEAMGGEGKLFIRVKLTSPHNIVVEIEDTGQGIKNDMMHLIFEPYFTTKPRGEGTGLGLSISKNIIDKHNGKIYVESVTGRTTFKVELPIKHNRGDVT